ncbi:MAG: hypothetical protein AAGF90_07645, partial [Pseudomonadota bacterium]
APAPTFHDCEDCVGAPKFILAAAAAIPPTQAREAASAASAVAEAPVAPVDAPLARAPPPFEVA